VSEMVLTQCINSLKIAIIIYRCIKKIQLVWCWPTKLSIICNSGIMNTTGAQNLKKFNNTAGSRCLDFCNELIK
jgi:hypothetical protein